MKLQCLARCMNNTNLELPHLQCYLRLRLGRHKKSVKFPGSLAPVDTDSSSAYGSIIECLLCLTTRRPLRGLPFTGHSTHFTLSFSGAQLNPPARMCISKVGGRLMLRLVRLATRYPKRWCLTKPKVRLLHQHCVVVMNQKAR